MFEVKIIETGFFMADGGAMFGAIPKRAWLRKYPCDENNRCRLSMRSVLAISDTKRILVDMGMGDKHLDKIKYYHPHQLKDISASLKEYDYSPDDITDVVITHLHFDHCGYATRKDEAGNILPTFPNATYWLSQQQWDNFLRPNLLEKDAYFEDNILPIHHSGLLQFIDNDIQLCEGFKVKLFGGHTPGQLVAYIQTVKGTVVFPGDLIPTASHIPLEWISAFDINALASLQEKERFLAEAAANNYTLIYCHDAYITSSKVKKVGDDPQNPVYRKSGEKKFS